MRPTILLLTLITGMFYLIYATLEFYSWILSFTIPDYGGSWWGLFCQGDLGWFISLLAVGMILFSLTFKRLNDYKGFSCLLVGSFLGVVLLVMQLLVVAASFGDCAFLTLIGEEAEYNLAEGLLTPMVVGGILSIPLLAYTLNTLKKHRFNLSRL